jgi:pathogenesis-related protein 1
MRLLLALFVFAVSANARAQNPWGYAPYPPSHAPYGGPYSPPVQNRSPASFTQTMLDAHNVIRARVGVPPLVWSARIAEVARDWANHLITTGAFGHRPDNRYGENIYSISNGSASPAQVVGYWAEEARGYDIQRNTCSGVCGHYTQIVWWKTQAVGCAVAGDGRREVWVCNYDPPGNVIGYRPY